MLKEVTQRSRAALKGKWLAAMGMIILYFVLGCQIVSNTVVNGLSPMTITNGITEILLFPLACGIVYYFINLARGNENIEDIVAFYIDFKTGLKLIAGIFYYMIIVVVGFCLFIVPGIVWAYRYTLFMMLIMDNRDMTIKESMAKSAELMKGNKLKYFWLVYKFLLIPFVILILGVFLLASNFSNTKGSALGNLLDYENGTSMFKDNSVYYAENYGDGSVYYEFATLKSEAVSIEDTENGFVITVNKDGVIEDNRESMYNVFEEDGKIYMSISSLDGKCDIEETGESYVFTVDDSKTSNSEIGEVSSSQLKSSNILLVALGLVLILVALVWFVILMPFLFSIETMFYVVLREKELEE